MKSITCIIIMILLFIASYGQNLIPNGDFESYNVCPNSIGDLSCTNWYSAMPSPDYYNICALSGSQVCIPLNAFGFQYPYSGDAYAGVWCKNLSNYREYLGVNLISPLQIGVKYYISFKVALATNQLDSSYCGVNHIGMHLSTDGSAFPIANYTNDYSKIYSAQLITDTSNWQIISGSFISDSSYDQIAFGNFFNDSLTDTLIYSGAYCQSYYWIDDVRLSEDSNYVLEMNNIKNDPIHLKVSPNPFEDYIIIENIGSSSFDIYLFDILGNELLFKNNLHDKYFRLNIQDTKENILILKVINGNNNLTFKLIKL